MSRDQRHPDAEIPVSSPMAFGVLIPLALPLPLLTPAERHQLLVEWNQTEADYPRDGCVHQLFEAQAARTPEAVAVVCGEQRLTYRELNTRANQLARFLRRRGVGPEVRVAISVDRSLEMIIGVLGILKAGGAYVPLDPALPRERWAFIARDSQARFLLTQQSLRDMLPAWEGPVLCLDRDRARLAEEDPSNAEGRTEPANLSHVLYTSGSTGVPKGVLGAHRGVVNYLTFFIKAYDLSSSDIVLQLASMSFVPWIRDAIGPLTAGAQLVLLPGEESKDPAAVLTAIRAHGITRLLAVVPSRLRALASTALGQGLTCPSVRLLIVGGEPLTPADCRRAAAVFGMASIVNLYGPTECTLTASSHPVVVSERLQDRVPIGRPAVNARLYVLDERLSPVPIGVAGELHIGGEGVARGYLNQPDLTAQRFIPNPFSDQPGARLYKTGDLARWLPDGTLEFLGRRDHQVKIRGFRIELGEIEAVLAQHPAVREAVVLAREDRPGDRRLVAYIVSDERGVTSDAGRVTSDADQSSASSLVTRHSSLWSEIRRFLRSRLPDYMLPAAFVRLPALPLTPNGKVDRRALPAPESTRPELDTAFVAPLSPIEKALAAIWGEVLGLEQVGVHDDFFTLGGHSLLATQVIARIRSTFQVEIPLRRLFETPTIAGLATAVTQCLGRSKPQIAQLLAMVERCSEAELVTGLPEAEG